MVHHLTMTGLGSAVAVLVPTDGVFEVVWIPESEFVWPTDEPDDTAE